MIPKCPCIPSATTFNMMLLGRYDLAEGATLGIELFLCVLLLAEGQGGIDFSPQFFEGDSIAGGYLSQCHNFIAAAALPAACADQDSVVRDSAVVADQGAAG